MKNLRYLMDYDPNSKNIGDYRNFIEKNIASLNNKDHCDPKERNNDHICFKFLVTSYPLGRYIILVYQRFINMISHC